ncbi:MAG: HlyC/CorC family transporter [Actinobacteria bacterium]|jgi:CBS domain containing-hemolysin-like protein|nr:HlyC/CorC family transporter [Actinomycetota bacterium]NCW34509.1 HlyC/CorC family transporter [Actinomycetota bacterium]NCZ73540.1 HlyC/CorC family transporter [Actinomycetota bacterium]NDA41120.1 HlyC/CorC family transporter [Actinomycetota bacterium]NDB31403.1 HlyC/CorC family transporter [Actinomycetota bacterium]
MNLIAILSVIGLLLFAGFLAGSESAINSISRVYVEELAEKSSRRAAWVARVLGEPARYLNVILFVRKACELTATVVVAEGLRSEIASPVQALALAIFIMMFLSYVVVGVGPRTLGKQRAGRWIFPASVVAVILSTVLGPVTSLLIAIGNAITPGKGFKSGPFANEAELRDLVDQAHERGLVEESEHEMIHSVFELGDTLVRELMVPRTEMVWIEGSKNLRQGLSLALRSGFTRIPVIGDDVDNVIGIAYVKDLARRTHEYRESEQSELVREHLRPATFVPETKTAAELLKEMQRDQIHLAIVVDEYGGTAGLITIEDILEEIVGEIADEYDDDVEEFEWISEGKARVAARLHIEDLAEKLEIDMSAEEREDVDTVGGFVTKSLGRVAIPGSEVVLKGWKISAERPIGRRHRIATFLVEQNIDKDKGEEV